MTVGESPGAVPAVPLNVGVLFDVEVPLAGAVSVTNGAVPVTVNVFAELRPTLPAASVCSACAV
jgi:hypothetical protein